MQRKEEPEGLLKKAWEKRDVDELNHAFSVFFDRYKGLVAFGLSHYFESEQDIEEVLNETFSTFFAHLGEYFQGKGKSYPKAYLMKIARNKALDRLRKNASCVEELDLERLPSPSPNRAYAEIEEDLRSFLNERETEIVLLVLEGYTAKEIGKMLRLTRSNVSVQYSRAVGKLRKLRKGDVS